MTEEPNYPEDSQPDEQESSPEDIETFLQRNKEIHEKLMMERRARDEKNRESPRYAFGQWMLDWRMEHGVPLRQFVINHNIDSMNYGKLERGVLAPPIDDPLTIHRLAVVVFGLEDESDEYYEFWNRAKDAHDAIIQIMNEPHEFDAGRLPVFVHKADGGRLNKQELNDLAQLIHEHERPTNVGTIFND
jgi:hypothetical protein